MFWPILARNLAENQVQDYRRAEIVMQIVTGCSEIIYFVRKPIVFTTKPDDHVERLSYGFIDVSD